MEELEKKEPDQQEVKDFYKQICLRKMDYLVNYDEYQIEDFKKKALNLAKQLLEI